MNVPGGHVLKLRKALYRLKQAARAWSDTFSTFIINAGFIRSSDDGGLFIYSKNNVNIFLIIYVDDILLFGEKLKLINSTVELIKRKFICRKEQKVNIPWNYNREKQ